MMLTDRLRASALARRYEELSARERRLVNIGGAVVTAAIVYLGVVDPVRTFHDDAVERHRQQQAQLEWMLRHRETAARQESAAPQPARNQSLLTLIDQTAREFGLRLASYRSESGGGVSVVVQEQPFNDILRWTRTLASEHGIRVIQASIDGQGAGLVNARFVMR
ncbi:MAG: type II secretion system protein M [Gammaproteobacteria bacterium]|nr:type II secretion system protein M [Gammaproteobacteria bacterium]MYE81506.1 type II secretion system protein M [Gammaproteobacteria bacterium]